MPGHTPPESCQPPPDPPSHSPRMARAATRRRSDSLKLARQRDLPAPSPACKPQIRHASRLVETARRDPLGMLFTWLTISIPRPRLSHQLAQNVGRGAGRELSRPGRNHARRDHRRLEQPEIVPPKIKQLLQVGDLRAGIEIHAHQADDGPVNDAQVGFDGRLRRPGARTAAPPGRSKHSARAPVRADPCPERKCRSSRCGSGPCAPGWFRAESETDRPARDSAVRDGCAARNLPECPVRNIH